MTKPRYPNCFRLIWVLLVLSCIGVLCYQMVDRIIYYYSWPVTVNVQINYNRTMSFPAVTICNQNAFKATAAAEKGWFQLVEDLYSNGNGENLNMSALQNRSGMPIDYFYKELAHRKEDFIVKCQLDSVECSVDRFESIVADHGVCYTFRQIDSVRSPGVEHGLRLTVNVEQYEYMPGPHDAAGIKLLLHDKEEFPLVHELGSAIPTGTHAFVGVKLLQLNNLPKPHGECSDGELNFYKRYTSETCRIDNQISKFEKICNCLPPHIQIGKSPVCSLFSYHNCKEHLNETEDSNQINDVTKACPVPCETRLYEPSISYASVSEYAVDKFLIGNASNPLVEKLLRAKEVKYRYEERQFNKTRGYIRGFEKEMLDVEAVLRDKVHVMIQNQIKAAREMFQNIKYIWGVKERMYRYQEYAVRKNFVRAKEAMEERNLHILYTGFTEFSLYMDRSIKLLINVTDDTQRQIQYSIIITMLENRMEIVRRAEENFTELMGAYKNGTRIFNYKFENISRKHNDAIVPKELLRHATNHSRYARDHSKRFTRYLSSMLEYLETYKTLTDVAFNNNTVNVSALEHISGRFLWSCRNLLGSRSVVNAEVIEWPLDILKSRLDAFNKLWEYYRVLMDDLLSSLEILNSSIESRGDSFLNEFRYACQSADSYLRNSSSRLADLADIFLRPSLHEAESNFKLLSADVRVRANFVYDTWPKLQEYAEKMWTTILDDTDSIEYYNFTQAVDFLRPLPSVILEVRQNYTSVQQAFDFRDEVKHKDRQLLDVFSLLSRHLTEFKNSIKIDSTFFNHNFLQVDIFYRQLSFEHVAQQVAYDGFALLCDIGGTMGLFVGASVLTIFEILDIVFRQLFRSETPTKK